MALGVLLGSNLSFGHKVLRHEDLVLSFSLRVCMMGVTHNMSRVLHLIRNPFPLLPSTLRVPVGTLGIRLSPAWAIFGPLIIWACLLGWIIDSHVNGPHLILGPYWTLDDL